jgi:hypothetical protein
MGARPEKSWRTASAARSTTQAKLQGRRQGTPAPRSTPWAGSCWAPLKRLCHLDAAERDPVKATALAFVREEAEASWVFGGEGARRTTPVRGRV